MTESRAMTAPAELVIDVTADDIAKGIRRDGGKCPIAVAIRRTHPAAAEAFVGGDLTREISIFWDDQSWPAIYPMPDEAVEFTMAFDGLEPVAPFTFTARSRS